MTSELYSFLWRCAGLAANEGVEARRRLELLHSNDDSRDFDEQLEFTELWLALAQRLYKRKRETPTEESKTEPVFRSQIDGLRETTSYRVFAFHQTSILARRFLLDVLRSTLLVLADSRTYIPIEDASADDVPRMELLKDAGRVLRCIYGGRKGDDGACLDAEGKFNLGKLQWLRDRRFASVRLLCFWLTGVGSSRKREFDKALGWWRAGSEFYLKDHRPDRSLQMVRDPEEAQFDNLVVASMQLASFVIRADMAPSERAQWVLRWAANDLLGRPVVEIGEGPPEDDSEFYEEEDGPDESPAKWRAEAKDTAEVLAAMAQAFTHASYDKPPCVLERAAVDARLTIHSDNEEPVRPSLGPNGLAVQLYPAPAHHHHGHPTPSAPPGEERRTAGGAVVPQGTAGAQV
jgi:hypothetical protein